MLPANRLGDYYIAPLRLKRTDDLAPCPDKGSLVGFLSRTGPVSFLKSMRPPLNRLAIQYLALLAFLIAVPTEAAVFRPAYAPAPADNPLKGFVPYAGQGKDFPHSLEFQYLPLASLMTGPVTFDWTPLERLMDDIAGRGCQTVFRMYLEYPGKPSGVPQFLLDAGVTLRVWTNTNTQPFPPSLDHTPDYEDPRLRRALTNFIAALGARYDGDPRLGFITAGLLGTWGEWHTHPNTGWFASKTVQAEILDAYEAAFRTTPVQLRYPAGDGHRSLAANARRRFGYHEDSFGWATLETGRASDSWFYLAALRKAGPAAMERWQTAPIGGEIRPELWPCLWKEPGCLEGQDFARCVKETHVSWLMESSTSQRMLPEERRRAVAAARSLGYEFQVLETSAAFEGRDLHVAVTITNRGVAPFYANWPVEVVVRGAFNEPRVARVPVELRRLLPGTATTGKLMIRLPPDVTESVELSLRIPNPLRGGKPLRFANQGGNTSANGEMALGRIRGPRIRTPSGTAPEQTDAVAP